MPLESALYIHDLVATNPASTDALQSGDDHLRLIKAVLQASFPNITAPVTASPSDLNSVTSLVAGGTGTVTIPATGTTGLGGSVVLKGQGSYPDVTLRNQQGFLLVYSATTQIASLDPSGNLSVAGYVNAGSLIKQIANALVPAGSVQLWAGSVGSIPAGWHLCDGTSGTPDLRGWFVAGAGGGLAVGQTGGAGSVTVATAAGGSHNHGGSTAAAGGHTHAASTDTQGAHSHGGATAGHVLTTAEMPSHTHDQYWGNRNNPGSSLAWQDQGNTGTPQVALNLPTGSTGSDNAHSHGLSSDGAHTHNVSVGSAPDHAHVVPTDTGHTHSVTVTTIPPFYALCYIMKT